MGHMFSKVFLSSSILSTGSRICRITFFKRSTKRLRSLKNVNVFSHTQNQRFGDIFEKFYEVNGRQEYKSTTGFCCSLISIT